MRHATNRPVTVLCALAAALALAPAALARQVRLSAHVIEPFQVSGRLFPASAIVIEHVRDYTPSSALSEVWVGTEFVGLLRADRVESAASDGRTSLAFERDARGTLVLVGYESAAHGMGAFRFHDARVESAPGPALAAARTPPGAR